jgi:hypothetical protein
MGYREISDQVKVEEAARASGDSLSAISELLRRSGVEPEEIDRVSSIKLSDYQQAYKDAEGEAHIIDLKATSLVLHPSWEDGPKWPLITPAGPTKVTFSGKVQKISPAETGHKVAAILPDPQFGFMRNVAGDLIPFHDPKALSASITMLRALKPDVVVILGDTFDLPVLGKYRKHPAYEQLINPTLQAGYEWLSAISSICDEVYMLEGNHDLRLQTYILDYAKEVFGIKRAGDPPDGWPVLSIPHLVHLDELGINYVPGYPVCRVELAPNLVAIHGKKLKLSQVISDEKVCVVQGHTHHAAVTYHQYRGITSQQQRWVASPGCLCKTDGTVPGVNHAIDPRSQEPIDSPQDWHQGIGVITYREDGSTTPVYEHAPIEDGVGFFRGKFYSSDFEVS